MTDFVSSQAEIRLRLGTRSSLLALAQSRQVADQLQRTHPGLEIELVELQSRGDRDRQTPLSDVQAADFFSDELDAALAAGDVDFCVHSWKDIDGPRPENFVRAAVPLRELPHDVLLFRSDIMDLLDSGNRVRIGTSSLRRQSNTADFLRWALPQRGRKVALEFVPLRGPVHERVKRIHTDAGAEQIDAVVLALAGLQRLWQDSAGREALNPLLNDARWMILPPSAVPTAPAQGALAVETLQANARCRDLLRAIHHPASEAMVSIEQQMVAEMGAAAAPGSEHDPARFGATALPDPVLGHVAWLRGRNHGNTAAVCRTRTAADTHVASNSGDKVQRWAGTSWQSAKTKTALDVKIAHSPAIFIAHADAWPDGQKQQQNSRYWTSGIPSWKQLARKGIWVEGCADHLGFESAKALLSAPVLQLPPLREWSALTHRDAVDSWSDSGIGTVIATYSITLELNPQQVAKDLASCTHFFWSSARQYRMLQDWLPAQAHHACGAGKTYRALLAAGTMNLRAFASRREWQQWLD
jgi:hydroxymethylbilane synthase